MGCDAEGEWWKAGRLELDCLFFEELEMPVFFHQNERGPTLVKKVVCHGESINCGMALSGLEHVCIGDKEGIKDE